MPERGAEGAGAEVKPLSSLTDSIDDRPFVNVLAHISRSYTSISQERAEKLWQQGSSSGLGRQTRTSFSAAVISATHLSKSDGFSRQAANWSLTA